MRERLGSDGGRPESRAATAAGGGEDRPGGAVGSTRDGTAEPTRDGTAGSTRDGTAGSAAERTTGSATDGTAEPTHGGAAAPNGSDGAGTAADGASTALLAARWLASTVRSTLGPHGLDTVLVHPESGAVVTDDGATIVDALDAEHPAAELLLDAARSQVASHGDGATTTLVLAGELAAVATDCLERGLHPTTVARGYDRALDLALSATDDVAIDVEGDAEGDAADGGGADRERLVAVARTALCTPSTSARTAHLADLVVRAALAARDPTGAIDRDRIAVHAFRGGAVTDSRLLAGPTVHRDPCHPDMPTGATDATVAVADAGIEVPEQRRDASATAETPADVAAFHERERRALATRVRRAVELDVDLLLVGGGVEPPARSWLADAGVLAVRRAPADARRRVADATGATPVRDLADLSPRDLGLAGAVERERVRLLSPTAAGRPERFLRVADAAGVDVATILLRGGTERSLSALERAVDDALAAVAAALEDGAVLPGAGATHLAAARAVRDAPRQHVREQLAVEAYADALEAIPRTLARNGGRDPIDVLAAARARHDAGDATVGIDAEAPDGLVDGGAADSLVNAAAADVLDDAGAPDGLVDAGAPDGLVDAGGAAVLDPAPTVRSSLRTATAVTTQLLRIDDVLRAGD